MSFECSSSKKGSVHLAIAVQTCFLLFISLFVCAPVFGGNLLSEVDISLFEERIENNRKIPVRISIVDGQGRSVSDASLTVKQLSHEFYFGNAPEYLLYAYAQSSYNRGRRFGTKPLPEEDLAEYMRLYLELFNFATLPSFYWADYEPTQGRLRLVDASKKIAGWLKENGIPVKGHTLVWGNPPSVGVPGWVERMGKLGQWSEVGELLFRRVAREVEEFKDLVQYWDVVNEPIVQNWFDSLGPDYIAQSYRIVKETDPDAITVLNEYGVLVNVGTRRAFISRARQLIDEGVQIDAIGAEAHIFTAQDLQEQLRSLESIYLAIDELAQLGKPIHISEFQIPLPAVIDAFKVSISEAEEIQAEIAKIFYKVFFSHPAVEVITYWNFYRAWQSGSGFLRDDLSIKPIFYELKDLIHGEWKTYLKIDAVPSGEVAFKGFAGNYEITVVTDGFSKTFSLDVSSKGENNFVLVIGKEQEVQ